MLRRIVLPAALAVPPWAGATMRPGPAGLAIGTLADATGIVPLSRPAAAWCARAVPAAAGAAAAIASGAAGGVLRIAPAASLGSRPSLRDVLAPGAFGAITAALWRVANHDHASFAKEPVRA